MLKRFSASLPLWLLALTLVVVHYRLLLGEVFFWGLPSLQFYPWREYAFSLLRGGQLPLWNPYNGAGAPLFANYQSALLYPFTWMGYVLPLAQSMSMTAVLHLFIAGWGMWRLMGVLGANVVGRGVSAFAFGMTSYLVARLGTFPVISAAAWLPWQLWAAHRLLTTGSPRSMAWLALFTALQLLAGHAQTTWYSLGIVGLYALWYIAAHRAPHRAPHRPIRVLRLIGIGAGVLLGAGVAGLQLLSTAELLAQSQRSGGVDYWTAMNFSYGPARTLNFLSPLMFGTPADGSYLTQGAYFEDAVYIGLIPLVAALAAVVYYRRKRAEPLANTVLFWLGIVVVGFVLALGQYSPIFPFLYEHVPTFDLFQAPVRWHLWTVFGLSALAGIGATWWPRGGRWTRRLVVACAGTALVTLLLFLFVPSTSTGMRVLARGLLLTSIFGALAGWLTLRKPDLNSGRFGRWSAWVFVVIAVDLGVASWGLNPTVTAAFYDVRDDGGAAARLYFPREAERALKYDQYFRFDDYRIAVDQWQQVRQLDLPDTNLVDRVPLLNNFDPLLPGPFVQYVNLLESQPDNEALLRAAGVSTVMDAQGQAAVQIPDAARAYVVAAVCWHETDAALEAALRDPAWNPHTQAQMLGDGGCAPADATPAGSVVVEQSGANEVILSVTMQRDGWLILADTDYPGWQATVDGQETPVYRANVLFRAVQVSAGTHTVTFTYAPGWLGIGALVSATSLVALALLFRIRSIAEPYNQE